jgi:hypothetical protein
LLRTSGTLSLIATKTIRQGDTRATGLRWIRQHSGIIYKALRGFRWPGEAAVDVCIIHIRKAKAVLPALLDGVPVPIITAFLFHRGSDDNPRILYANAGASFIGSYPLGMGFTFDDHDPKGVASPIGLMHELIAKDPRNAERIRPFWGGDAILSSSAKDPERYIIDFGDMSLAEARQWPDLFAIILAKVKPQRDGDNRASYKNFWWRFAERRSSLYAAIARNHRVLVTPHTAKHPSFAFLDNGATYDQQLIVFALQSTSAFGILQSLPHELWISFFGCDLGGTLRYGPEDIFATFPFPDRWGSSTRLARASERMLEARTALLQEFKGLTPLYNAVHQRLSVSEKISFLRDTLQDLDRIIFNAYGWTDISERRSFLPDLGGDEKSIRFTLPLEVQEEILARLQALNIARADAEGCGEIRSLFVDDAIAFQKEAPALVHAISEAN